HRDLRREGRVKRALLDRLLHARRAKRPAAVVTDLDSGEQWLYEAGEPPPSALGEETLAAIRTALRTDRARPLAAGGQSLFVTVWNPPLRMIVIGAVHIAQPLVGAARLAGFELFVIDPRHAFATDARFPDVRVSTQWPDEALTALAPDARCAIVALTH